MKVPVERLARFLQESAHENLVSALDDAKRASVEEGKACSLPFVVQQLILAIPTSKAISQGQKQRIEADLIDWIEQTPRSPTSLVGKFAFNLAEIVEPLKSLCKQLRSDRVTALVFLIALLSPNFLEDADAIRLQEIFRAAEVDLPSLMGFCQQSEVMVRDFTYQLLGFGEDLTAKAHAGFWKANPLIGMEKHLQRLVIKLNSRNSVVLLGEPGVGKSVLVEGLAYGLALGALKLIPERMRNWTIVAFTRDMLMADTAVHGSLEKRVKNFLSFFDSHPTVIPFFDEIHTLLDTSSDAAKKLATSLKPPMANGRFCCIGATTDREFGQYMQHDEALASRFSRVFIPEPRPADACTIIERLLPVLTSEIAREQKVQVPLTTVSEVVELTDRYQKSDRLPRKAIRFLQSAIDQKAYDLALGETRSRVVNREFVRTIAREEYGLPVDQEEPQFWQRVREQLLKVAPNQQTAVQLITNRLFRKVRGWYSGGTENSPSGRFLFLGPPDVGQHEIVVALSEILMGDRNSLIWENMSQFTTPESRTKLVGAPPAYRGFRDTKNIFSRVASRPNSLIYFANFEVTHPDLEDEVESMLAGYAKDPSGNALPFDRTIVVLNSHLQLPSEILKNGQSAIHQALLKVGGIWSNRLLAQIDETIVFDDTVKTNPKGFDLDEVLRDLAERAPDLDLVIKDKGFKTAIQRATEKDGLSVHQAVNELLRAHSERILISQKTKS